MSEQLTLDRRRFLQALAAAGCAGAVHTLTWAKAGEKVKTTAHIVILGGGSAGISLANRFAETLDGAKITVIDPRKDHWYWPGFTLVGAGIKPAEYVKLGEISQYIQKPGALEWLHTKAKEIDPEANKITLEDGQTIQYDYLVLTTGLSYDYNAIEGMNTDLIGKDGIASIYLSPEAAAASWQAMGQFLEKGGKGIFTRPNTEMRCAGAPLKYALLTEDRLTRSGQRKNAELAYYTPHKVLFGVPIVSEKVRMTFEERKIKPHFEQKLVSIDPAKKVAVFEKVTPPPAAAPAAPAATPAAPAATAQAKPADAKPADAKAATPAAPAAPAQAAAPAPAAPTPTPAAEAPKAERTEVAYDFIHVVPPMVAPEVVRKSPLAWQEDENFAPSKAWAKQGWAEVDKETLQHKRYDNVYAVGDIAGIPKGKTAASVKWQVPVAVDQIVSAIAGKEATEKYNGYTSCPLITRLGRAMLIEFDFKDNLYYSLPNIVPALDESWAAWVLKTMALKPTYVAMLQGKA